MESRQIWNDQWFSSPYYHLLEGERIEASLFIRKLVQYLHPHPGARILDVGCGRGSRPEEFAAPGYEVTGIAVTEGCLPVGMREPEQDALSCYVHDLRLPFWIRYFDYAVNLFDCFGHFGTDRENENVLKTMCHSLKKGGLLCLDCQNGVYEREHLVTREDRLIAGVEFSIERVYEQGIFLKRIQVLDVVHLADLKFAERTKDYRKQDLEQMLSAQGMRLEDTFGDYHFNVWDERLSPRLILVARRVS